MATTRPIIMAPLLGIDQRWGADDKHANVVRDMRWNGAKGAWESSGGYFRIIYGSLDNGGNVLNPFRSVGVVQSLHFFSQHNGARAWLIYEDGNGNLYQFNPSTAARSSSPGDIGRLRDGTQITDRAVLETPWQKSQSCTWGDYLYLVNGINRPLVFDGYSWDYAGFSGQAGIPSATPLTRPHMTDFYGRDMPGVGLGPTSDVSGEDYVCGYRYRVSYVNKRGQESPLSPASSLVTFTNTGGTSDGEGATLVWVGIPVGGPEVIARRIYRTQNTHDSNGDPVAGYAEQFFFHSEIPDNSTRGFLDSLSDDNLGTMVDELDFGPWPTGAKYIAPFKGTMFAAGTNTAQVFYSAPNRPEVFPPDNVIDLGDADLGPIMGLYPTRNALVVFKSKGVYLIKGDPVNGFFPILLTREVGCAAPNTIREVPNVGLVFVSDSGIHALLGTLENEGALTRVVPLHVPIGEWVQRVNRSALIGAFASVYHRDKEVWFALPTIGSEYNDLVLVLHYEVSQMGEWSYREDFPINCMLETSDHRGYLLFGSWDSADHPGIHVYSVGWPDKDGVAIAPLYQTGWIDAGAIWRSMKPQGAEVHCGLHGNNVMQITVTTNRKQAWDDLPTQAQQYPEDVQPVFGTATFDSGTLWQELRPGTLRWDFSGPQYAMVHEAALTFQPDEDKRWMTLMAVSLEVAADDPDNWKPLTSNMKAGR